MVNGLEMKPSKGVPHPMANVLTKGTQRRGQTWKRNNVKTQTETGRCSPSPGCLEPPEQKRTRNIFSMRATRGVTRMSKPGFSIQSVLGAY